MHIILAIAAAAAAVYFFVIRARNAAEMTTELMDVANDVRLAARRFGFRRNASQHPVEAIDDERIAVAGTTFALLSVDYAPLREEVDALAQAMDDEYPLTRAEADEMMILARWLVDQCGTADAAISRLSRKLYKQSGTAALEPLMRVINATFQISGSALSERQKEALGDISRALHVR